MDIASIALHFLCAAVAGFLIMSIFGVQALVALCSSISLADAFVKVITRISDGRTPAPRSPAILWVITVVFPDPGPARTSMGPVLWDRAVFCASLNFIIYSLTVSL